MDVTSEQAGNPLRTNKGKSLAKEGNLAARCPSVNAHINIIVLYLQTVPNTLYDKPATCQQWRNLSLL